MKIVNTKFLTGVVMGLICQSLQARVELKKAYIGKAPPSIQVLGGYGIFQNLSEDEFIFTKIKCQGFDKVEFHETIVDSKGYAKMVSLEELKIGAREKVSFVPGGKHFMLYKSQMWDGPSKEAKCTFYHKKGKYDWNLKYVKVQ